MMDFQIGLTYILGFRFLLKCINMPFMDINIYVVKYARWLTFTFTFV